MKKKKRIFLVFKSLLLTDYFIFFEKHCTLYFFEKWIDTKKVYGRLHEI